MARTLRIALAQLKCELLNKGYNLKRSIEMIKEAKQKQADYVLFPELFLTGYIMNEQIKDLGETVEGESVQAICACAKEYQIGVIFGFPEKQDDCLYNSAVFINKNGEIVDVYRKTHLYHEEQKHFSSGDRCVVIEAPEGKFGLLITYDLEFPEMARLLALQGAEIIFILSANMVPYQIYQNAFVHSRAIENHLFTAVTNKVGLHIDNIFFGESQVVAPDGKTIYKADNNEILPVVEIDLEETERSKGVLNYLSNRRPEFYRGHGL
ncbi:carbon-nitrogen hydrolase family protein [Bacillus sp. CFBP9009]